MTEERKWHHWKHQHGKGRRGWLYGAWHIISTDGQERTAFHIEWSLLNGYEWNRTLGLRFGRNGSESDVGLDVHVPVVGSTYLRVRSPWTKRFNVDDPDDPAKYSARHYSLQFNYAGSWVSGEIGALDGMYSRDEPKWRNFTLGHRHIFGRTTYESVLEDTGVTVVPMPEGIYSATWKRSHHVKGHVRWPGKLLDVFTEPRGRSTYSIDVEGGIPAWGKGENSYDCGMDGTFGISGGFRTVEEAVGAMVEASLRDRRKYGGPHDLPEPMTVGQAEAHMMNRDS